jgi:CheY-like chemotaxis protein
MVEGLGLRPVAAAEGSAALAALDEAAAAGEPLGLAIVDANMPGLDGFTLVERMNRSGRGAPATVLLLSSHDRQGDVARCKALGGCVSAVKPVKQSDLVKALRKLHGLPGAQGTMPEIDLGREGLAAPEPEPLARRLQILLVDDNPFNQKVGSLKLAKPGHAVEVAGSGREALDALARGSFDLVLMDMQMPDMDGLEATAAIRRQEQHTARHIPIIAMTAHAMAEVRDRCLAAGMDGYVAKPIQDRDLWREIARVVPCAAARPETEPPADASAAVLDQATVLDRVGGNVGLLQELIAVFRDDCSRLLPDLRQALDRRDPAGVRLAAHTLKGMVGFFAAEQARAAAYALEKKGAAADLGGAEEDFAALIAGIERLQAALMSETAGSPS